MKDEQFEMLMKEIKGIKSDITELKGNVAQLQKDGERRDDKIEALADQLNTTNVTILSMNTEIAGIKTDVAEMKSDIKAVKDEQILLHQQMSKMIEHSSALQSKTKELEQDLNKKADLKEIMEHNEIMQDSINILYALSKVNDKQHVEYDKKLNIRRA